MFGLRESDRPARRHAVSAVAAALLGAAVAACAVAPGFSASTTGPRWLAPVDLSAPGGDGLVPQVAMDARGDVFAVWVRTVNNRWTVQATERRAGRQWGKPRNLSTPADHVGAPEVVANSTGRAVAVWERFDGRHLIAQTSRRSSSTGKWSLAADLSPAGQDAISPRVAIDEKGNAVAVWATLTLSGWTVQSTYRPANGDWQEAVNLFEPRPGAAAPDVAIDPAGNVTAVWAATGGGGWTVESAYRGAGGSWGDVESLSAPDRDSVASPRIAVDGAGDTIVVWSRSGPKGSRIEVASRPAATGIWSKPQTLSLTGLDSVAPQIAMNDRGDAAIVWASSEPSALTVYASFQKAAGAWLEPRALSRTSAGPLAPEIAIDQAGNAVAVWNASSAGHSAVQAATRSAATGAWTAARTLSKPGQDALTPKVALDGKGDGALVWSTFVKQNFVVQALGYDATGPDIGKMVVPAGGVAGRTLAFAVSVTDVWSKVAAIRWSFGDGQTATGNAVTHAYVQAGRYDVRVTAVDSLGHATSLKRSVAVS